MIQFKRGVYIRHINDESIVWCPRSGGCTVLKNAQPILEEVSREWREIDNIVHAVAAKFECAIDEVREGVEAVVGELISQRFVEVDCGERGMWILCGAARTTRPPRTRHPKTTMIGLRSEIFMNGMIYRANCI